MTGRQKTGIWCKGKHNGAFERQHEGGMMEHVRSLSKLGNVAVDMRSCAPDSALTPAIAFNRRRVRLHGVLGGPLTDLCVLHGLAEIAEPYELDCVCPLWF